MNLAFERSFAKDLKHLTDASVRRAIEAVLVELKAAHSLDELPSCKKLHGIAHVYRLRVGDYRIGIELRPEDNTAIVVRCLHRKEIYRYFP
jgi:mRNA interferase RelE/StbE